MSESNKNSSATELAVLPASSPVQLNASDLILNDGAMDRIYKFAETMAKGVATVPKHLQGNVADCFAVCTQAHLWQMNPFAVAQKTHISQSGALGYEAQLVNAAITTLAPIQSRPDYEFLGDWSKILGKIEAREGKSGGKYYVANWKTSDEEGLGVILRCTLRGESAPRELRVMMTQAYPRFSTQWATDPQQQICYLAIRKWARRYVPDVLLGVYTPEELSEAPSRDMGAAEVVEKKVAGLSPEVLAEWKSAAEKGTDAVRKHWAAASAEIRRAATQDQKDAMWATAVAADKARTVDNTPPPADAPVSAETGEVDASFVAAMDRAESDSAG
jgi:hypothetical protein